MRMEGRIDKNCVKSASAWVTSAGWVALAAMEAESHVVLPYTGGGAIRRVNVEQDLS